MSSGVKEIKDLGRRLREIVPEEFRHGSNMLVISSDTERTIDSAKAFLSTVRILALLRSWCGLYPAMKEL